MRFRTLVMIAAALVAVLAAVPSVPAAGQEAGDLSWLALGDSYSSGEGIPGTSSDADVNGTSPHGRNCQRADGLGTEARAWSVSAFRELSNELGFGTQALVACTGAVTSEVDAQIAEGVDRIGRGSFDLITLSIGGNDIGFSQVVRDCLDRDSVWGALFGPVGCDETEQQLRDRVDQMLVPRLAPTYDLLAEHVDAGGDVIVVGYPHIVEEPARWATWRYARLGFCQGMRVFDVQMLRSVTGYLNEQIGQAVLAADERHRGSGVRFHFLDISHDPYEYSDDPGSRHGLCARDQWINGISTSITSGDWRIERSFHPNQEGHDNTGRVLAQYLREHVRFDDRPLSPAEVALEYLRRSFASESIDDLVATTHHDHSGAPVLLDDPAPSAENEWLLNHKRDEWGLTPGRPRSPGMDDLFGPGCSLEGDAAILCIVDYGPEGTPALSFPVWIESDFDGFYLVSSIDEPVGRADPRSREVAAPAFFTSPSGNIACSLEGDMARCDTASNDWGIAPVSEDVCILDYGNSIVVTTEGPAKMFCHGDTNFGAPGSFELGYGETVMTAYFSCTSAESGVTCRTRRLADHGFKISRASYELW